VRIVIPAFWLIVGATLIAGCAPQAASPAAGATAIPSIDIEGTVQARVAATLAAAMGPTAPPTMLPTPADLSHSAALALVRDAHPASLGGQTVGQAFARFTDRIGCTSEPTWEALDSIPPDKSIRIYVSVYDCPKGGSALWRVTPEGTITPEDELSHQLRGYWNWP
jgi:hypothetical protein